MADAKEVGDAESHKETTATGQHSSSKSGQTHPLDMKRRMALATVATGSARNQHRTRSKPSVPSLFLTQNLLRGGGLLLLLGLRVGFGLLL